MQRRRILIFVIVFLIILPIVTATADGVEKSADEGLIIRLGSLHEGERFVYDLHLTSTYRDLDIHIPAFHEIEIGRIRDFQTLDGATHDVLATTIHEKVAPWDAPEGEHGQGTTTTQYLRISDGVYIERFSERAGSRTFEQQDDQVRSHWTDERRIEGDWIGGNMYGRGIYPESAYLHGNAMQHALISLVTRIDGRVHEVGEHNGRTVYDISGRTWTQPNQPQLRCATTHPETDYTDFAAMEELAGRAVTESYTLRTWVEPGLAYPVLDACHARYTDGDTVVEDLHLALELTAHEPGAAAIPVDWDRTNSHPNYAPFGPATPLPTVHAGVPQGGDMLGVPLARAVETILASDEPALRGWMDPEPHPFWLVEAIHRPMVASHAGSEAAPDGPTTPVPLPVSPPSVPTEPTASEEPRDQEARRTGIAWDVRLANQAGESLQIALAFNETQPGVFADGHILQIQPGHEEDPLIDGRLTHELVPLDALVERFLAETHVDPDAWLHDGQSIVRLENRIIDDGDGRFRTFHSISFSTTDPAAPDDPSRSTLVVRDYDTRNGAPLQAGHTESWTVDDEPAPQAPSYGTSSGTALTPIQRFPTAATASGFALAVGFAAAFFWDTVARTFGQFIGAPLHAKIRKDKVLDHRTRDRIADLVASNPGIALEEVRREVAVGYGTVCHHLDTLQRNGLVTSRKVGRRRCYFVPGAVDAGAMDALGVSGTEAAGRFLDVVTAEPGITQGEIAARLRVADSSVRYHARRLIAHDRVRAERVGRTVRYYPHVLAPAA